MEKVSSNKILDSIKTFYKNHDHLVKSLAVVLILGLFISTDVAYAGLSQIFNKFSTSMKDIYKEIVTISTVVGVFLIAICLIMKMITRDPRAVAEWNSWAKRVALTWLILNSLGYLVAYGKDLITGTPAVW